MNKIATVIGLIGIGGVTTIFSTYYNIKSTLEQTNKNTLELAEYKKKYWELKNRLEDIETEGCQLSRFCEKKIDYHPVKCK